MTKHPPISTFEGTVNLNQPLKSYPILLGSCNGILCITNSVGNIAIWNPSLRKHWILPHNPTAASHRIVPTIKCVARAHGFGFDSFTGDYKLVKISYFKGDRSTFECKVSLFSCITDAWKTLPSIPYALCWSGINGVFVAHALHWPANNHCELTGPKLIVAFDLRFEVFDEVPLPQLGEDFEIEVSLLGGCLNMAVNYENTRLDIWVMKQYGYKDSWFKLFTLESPELRSLKFVRPLGYYFDGMEKVLFIKGSCKLFWYNLKSKKVSHFTILAGIYTFYKNEIWVESLVQPPFLVRECA